MNWHFNTDFYSLLVQITNKCLPALLKLQYLEELNLEGCFGINDDGLVAINQGSGSLKVQLLVEYE